MPVIVSGDADGERNAMVVGRTTVVSWDPVVVAAWIGKMRHSFGRGLRIQEARSGRLSKR